MPTPNIYHLTDKQALVAINEATIPRNSIILGYKLNKKNKLELSKVWFVSKQERGFYVPSIDLNTKSNENLKIFISEALDKLRQPLRIEDDGKYTHNKKGSKIKFKKAIDEIANELGFRRYNPISITIGKNGRLLFPIPKKEGDGLHSAIKASLKENEHVEGFAALKLIRKLYEPEAQQYITNYKNRKGTETYTPVQAMGFALQNANPAYKDLFDSMKKIPKRRLTEYVGLTDEKEKILNNFKDYCCLHAEKEGSHEKLIENWIKTYVDNGEPNPFLFLNQHRREGKLAQVARFFNPSQTTDSYKLFEKFIGKGQVITKELYDEMHPVFEEDKPKNEQKHKLTPAP